MKAIVARYNVERAAAGRHGKNVEFEVRVKLAQYADFEAMVQRLLAESKEVKVSRSINFITPLAGDKNLIHTITLDNKTGKRASDTWSYKERLMPAVNYNEQCRFALSAEYPAQPQTSDTSTLIRTKDRISFILPIGAARWSFDLTKSYELENSIKFAAEIKAIVNAMKSARDVKPENFLKAARIDDIMFRNHRFELECEWLSGELTTADVEAVLSRVFSEDSKTRADQRVITLAAKLGVQAKGTLYGLLPRVKVLTREEYRNKYPPSGFFITPKADGERGIVDAAGKTVSIMSTSEQNFELKLPIKQYILDGEVLPDSMVIFDVLFADGKSILSEPFEKRVKAIPAACSAVNAAIGKIYLKPKLFIRIPDNATKENVRAAFDALSTAGTDFKQDGVVMIAPGKGYFETDTYKIKFGDDNTVDVFARRYPDKYLGPEPFIRREGMRLYILFVSLWTQDEPFITVARVEHLNELIGEYLDKRSHVRPVQLSMPDMPYAFLCYLPESAADIGDKIVEVALTGREDIGRYVYPKWKIVKIRDDRAADLKSGTYFGNSYRVNEVTTWRNYLDPLTPEDVRDGPRAGYFVEKKLEMYHAQTGFMSFVKTEFISNLAGYDWVVDLGFGQGQDIGRYIRAKIKHLVAVDSDAAALATGLERRYTPKKSREQYDRVETMIYAICADVRREGLDLYDKIAKTGMLEANALVVSLAVHYFMTNPREMNTFVRLVQKLIANGGCGYFLYMDGARVFEKLRELKDGETWNLHEGASTVKYSIIRRFKEDKLLEAGQMIDVLLPFSSRGYYTEPLVNTAAFIAKLEAKGFTVKRSGPITDHLPIFAQKNKAVYSQLTAADREYLGLYQDLIIERKAKGVKK